MIIGVVLVVLSLMILAAVLSVLRFLAGRTRRSQSDVRRLDTALGVGRRLREPLPDFKPSNVSPGAKSQITPMWTAATPAPALATKPKRYRIPSRYSLASASRRRNPHGRPTRPARH